MDTMTSGNDGASKSEQTPKQLATTGDLQCLSNGKPTAQSAVPSLPGTLSEETKKEFPGDTAQGAVQDPSENLSKEEWLKQAAVEVARAADISVEEAMQRIQEAVQVQDELIITLESPPKRKEKLPSFRKSVIGWFAGRDNAEKKSDLGRNSPCHCGSGKKYKKCCWHKDLQT